MFDITAIFLFNGLTQEEKKEIAAVLPAPISFEKGETIESPEGSPRCLGIITDGRAAAFSGNFIKRGFAVGDTFGAAAIFGGNQPYISRIKAYEKTSVLFLSEKFLKDLFKSYPRSALNYISFLSSKIVFLNKKIDQFSAGSATGKLYSFLLNSAGSENCVTVPNMTVLARLTGIGRTSLYRAFEELEQNGMIERKNNTIRVITK